jgi:phosphoglycolate phosphatase-like HAD superfamily hydrolase
MIKNIFFDFDGVLVDSVNVKTQAFYNLYEPFGEEVAQKVKEHHLLNGGISRYEKIKHYHKTFLGKELNEKEVNEFANKFAALVVQGVIHAPEVKGASAFLERNKNKFRYWIISGTPANELRTIVEKRKISHYFKGIYGAPEKKTYWTEFILKQHNLKREETVYAGDAMADYEVAKSSGLHFILRESEENKKLFESYKVPKFSDFNELEKLITGLL